MTAENTPMSQTDWKKKRGRLAARTRHHGPDDPQVRALATEFAVDRLEEHVRRIVDGSPPLTGEQRDRIAVLLRPIQTGGDAA